MCKFLKLEQLLNSSLTIKDKTILYLFRHAQSIGNYAGTIAGWSDSKLSVEGRKEANELFKGLYKNIGNFTHFHTSDLSRCRDTFNICTGFSGIAAVETSSLRELNFGDQEGAHYDSMPE
jgi:broad specificity phosphatase PhoE